MNVVDAHARRVLDREGVRCCEVEVRTDSGRDPELLVYFGRSADNDYDMIAILRNDADPAIDWFNNSMHEAFEERSVGLFETSGMEIDWGLRETFKEQVLAFPGVRMELGRLLGQP